MNALEQLGTSPKTNTNDIFVTRVSEVGGPSNPIHVNMAMAGVSLPSSSSSSSSLLLLTQGGTSLQRRSQLALQKCCQLFGCLFEESAAGVSTVHVQIEVLLCGACVATIFTDIEFVPALLVGIMLLHPVNFL